MKIAKILFTLFCIWVLVIVCIASYRFIIPEYKTMEVELLANQVLYECKKYREEHTMLKSKCNFFEKQVRILYWNRPGRKKNLANLNKLIKERNKQFGIGGGDGFNKGK